MKKKVKIIAISFLASIGVGVGLTATTPVTTSAATSAPEIEIVGQTLSLENTIHIKYAVDVSNTEATDDVGMLLWKEAQESYVYGTQAAILEESDPIQNGDVTYQTFVYENLAACEMTDVVYTCAYVERNGTYYYSAPKKYSILEYAYNKLGETEATATTDEDLKNLLNSMLSYGAMTQIYFDYNLDKLATDDFTYVRMDNAVFEDGFSYGIFKVGEQVKFTIKEGYHVRADLLENIAVDNNGGYILTVPNEKYIESTLIHNYVEVIDEAVSPTCTQTGLTQGKRCSACGEVIIEQETIPASGHTYDQEVASGSYLQSEATCTESAKYYYSCDCGERGTETFDYGEPADCNYVNGICQWCGQEAITEGLVFTLINEDTEYSVTDYTGTATEVYIPSTYNGKPVTSIGESAFANCDLTSVTIPDSVTNIGSVAFYTCMGLTEIVIPDSVTSIGSNAFAYCINLISVEISDSMTSIAESAFYYCRSLTEIVIPDSVTNIGSAAFSHCSSLTEIVIPDSVTNIGISAFYDCMGLTEIVIPDSVTSIGDNAFKKCIRLTEIVIPDSVTSINSGTFSECSSLTEIVIPNSVTKMGSDAFSGCSSLAEIVISDSVTSIGDNAFYGCSSLTSITFKDTSTWYYTEWYSNWEKKTGGTQIDVTNSSSNVTYFTDTYHDYYLYKL